MQSPCERKKNDEVQERTNMDARNDFGQLNKVHRDQKGKPNTHTSD